MLLFDMCEEGRIMVNRIFSLLQIQQTPYRYLQFITIPTWIPLFNDKIRNDIEPLQRPRQHSKCCIHKEH